MAVDVDELTLGRVSTAVRGTEFAVEALSYDVALDRVRTAEIPVILLLEWTAADAAERVRLCESLRQAAGADRFYIVALGGPADHAALRLAAEGPADDALSRPFNADLLLVRLRQSVRAMRQATAAITPADALDEALAHGSGEVCVRSGDTVARLHVEGGSIVWANVSSAPSRMEDVAGRGGVHLDAELIAAVKQECRATGAHFMDVLVQWGMIAADDAREALRAFVSERVKMILELPGAKALFLPKAKPQKHTERLGFRASEIPLLERRIVVAAASLSDRPAPESRRLPLLSDAALQRVVDSAMRTDGAISAAVLERGTGTCLRLAGEVLDTEIAWSQVSALAALGPGAEEVLAATAERFFVTRALGGAPSLMLFVSLASAHISLGLARAAIAAVAARGLAPSDFPGDADRGGPGGQ